MKTKRAGREMNPTDAYRKQARKRENKRNKAERTYIRDAYGKAQNTNKLTELKTELEELIHTEQTGELNKLQKLRKKIVQEAYEVAIRKKKEEDLKKKQAEEEGTQQHAGLSSVPLPKPPPLPTGPKPGLPPPPMPPPLPAGPVPTAAGFALLPPPLVPPPSLETVAAAAAASNVPVLPPPPGPPPPAAMLPPPPGPPPLGMLPPPPGPPPMPGMLPPPAMPPPGMGSMLPPPAMPPHSSILPPPAMPPPGSSSTITSSSSKAAAAAGGAPTITGASTVAKRPLAHKDKALTSMVPASVLVKREAAAKAAADGGAGGEEELRIGPGFGLAPMQRAGGPGSRGTQKQQLAPPPQLGRWGNAVSITSVPAGAAGKGAAGRGAGAPAAGAGAGGAAAAGKVDDQLNDFMASLKELGAFD